MPHRNSFILSTKQSTFLMTPNKKIEKQYNLENFNMPINS
jgi:hypothetical protein